MNNWTQARERSVLLWLKLLQFHIFPQIYKLLAEAQNSSTKNPIFYCYKTEGDSDLFCKCSVNDFTRIFMFRGDNHASAIKEKGN